MSSISFNVPGWYWLRGTSSGGIRKYLVNLAARDRDADVRIGAIRVLRDLSDRTVRPSILKVLAKERDQRVGKELIRLILEIGEKSDIATLEELGDTGLDNLARDALAARNIILARLDPNRFLQELIDGRAEYQRSALSELRAHSSSLHADTLLRAFEIPAEDLRSLAVTELERRDLLPTELATRLKADPNFLVREAAYLTLVKRGEAITPDAVRTALTPSPPSNPLTGRSGFLGGLGLGAGLFAEKLDPDRVLLEIFGGR